MQDLSEQDLLILVDRRDHPIGFETKVVCHRHPLRLHRAFSIFLFDRLGRMLITKRSRIKATWPGYWTNACCSHPRKGESTGEAARRRLREELGISTNLSYLFKFLYEAPYGDFLGERELDHVFAGWHEGPPVPDPREIEDWRFMGAEDLKAQVREHPDRFTPWFRICLDRVLEAWERMKKNPRDAFA